MSQGAVLSALPTRLLAPSHTVHAWWQANGRRFIDIAAQVYLKLSAIGPARAMAISGQRGTRVHAVYAPGGRICIIKNSELADKITLPQQVLRTWNNKSSRAKDARLRNRYFRT
jgi:hypothetical protein